MLIITCDLSFLILDANIKLEVSVLLNDVWDKTVLGTWNRYARIIVRHFGKIMRNWEECYYSEKHIKQKTNKQKHTKKKRMVVVFFIFFRFGDFMPTLIWKEQLNFDM